MYSHAELQPSSILTQTKYLKPIKQVDGGRPSYRALLAAPGMLAALVVFTWSGTMGEAIAAGQAIQPI